MRTTHGNSSLGDNIDEENSLIEYLRKYNEEEDQKCKEEIKNQEVKKQTTPTNIILTDPRIIKTTIQQDKRTQRAGRNYKTKSRRSRKQIKHPTVHRKK